MRTNFAGIAFDATTLDEALEWLVHRRGSPSFAYVVTPNVDHAIRLSDNPDWDELHEAYTQAHVSLCDSRILAILARLFGKRLSVAPGSDLTAHFLARKIPQNSRVFLIGGDEGTCGHLRMLTPGVKFLQHIPPRGLLGNPDAMDACVQAAAAARADYILLAVGSPQQELIAHRIANRVDATGTALCIGASIDFLTGRTKRAPLWMQRLALEWLHRLLVQPRRMARRYLIDGPRIIRIAFMR